MRQDLLCIARMAEVRLPINTLRGLGLTKYCLHVDFSAGDVHLVQLHEPSSSHPRHRLGYKLKLYGLNVALALIGRAFSSWLETDWMLVEAL